MLRWLFVCVICWLEMCCVPTNQAGLASATPVTSIVPRCYQCNSYQTNGAANPQCPADASVNQSLVYLAPCVGHCFTRTDSANPQLVYRGCSQGQWGLPNPLPPDGCYRWTSLSQLWCLCSTNRCNGHKIGEAGNVTFESLVLSPSQSGNLPNDTVLPPSFVSGANNQGVLQCWQCLSYFNGRNYTQCPLHDRVDVNRAYFDNCNGRCISHNSYDVSGIEVMVRGCSSQLWGLPNPLPEDGCYRWHGNEVWCVCSTDGCNGLKLGEAGNVTFDFHLLNPSQSGNLPNDTVLPPSYVSGANSQLQCWQCLSYFKGQNYTQCPLHDRVDVNRAYIDNCTGFCISHNKYDEDLGIEVMVRGCSSLLWGLPDPLPEDGCYRWHGNEVWCVCSTNGCNGVKLGAPGLMPFDAHTRDSSCHVRPWSSLVVAVSLVATVACLLY